METGLTATIAPGRTSAAAARLGPLGLAVAVAATLFGCATTAPQVDKPVDTRASAHDRWVCEALDGGTSAPWTGEREGWREDAGVLSSVHATPWGHGGEYGRSTEEDALRGALASAASSAVDLLERRGLSYARERREEIEARTVDALLSGEGPSFPRVRLADQVVEHCWNEATGEDTWRARVSVQYAIGELRGDVINATWEREQLLRDVEVLRASASTHFAQGRWFDGRLELERALDRLSAVGASGPRTSGADVPVARWGSPDATQADRASWHRIEIGRVETPLSVEAMGGIDVVEIGARAAAEAAFLVAYTWQGAKIPAAGVPMRYEAVGDVAAILDGDPVTGGDGVARCRILRAYGDPGEYRLVAAVDADLVGKAGVGALSSVVTHPASPDGDRASHAGGPHAFQTLFLVSRGHGVSVCAEFTGDGDRDAGQARAGFVQRVANDGFRTEECGPGVDVVVSAEVRLMTAVAPGSWTAEVTIDGSAFDQRVAREIGGTTITVAETSTEGQRDAELRALREGGRLLAVYLSGRMLTSGR